MKEIKLRVLESFEGDDVSIALFGSMAGGRQNTGSDVDVALLSSRPIDRGKLALLREALEESSIPYLVDIVDFSDVSEDFREHALANVIWWKK